MMSYYNKERCSVDAGDNSRSAKHRCLLICMALGLGTLVLLLLAGVIYQGVVIMKRGTGEEPEVEPRLKGQE